MINLTLHVIEAKNLINTGSIRVSDPYCKITVNNETKKSRAIHNTTNPRWDYRFYFQNVPLDAPIAIEVFDKNLIRSHSFMGRMYVTVNQLRQQTKGWWPLTSREGEGNLGSIYLQADFIELQRVLFNEMQYRYVNVPPQQAQMIPQGQTVISQLPSQTVMNQQLPTQTVGNTTPIVVGQGTQPQVVVLPSQGQVFSGQGSTQTPVTHLHQKEPYRTNSPDMQRDSTFIPPQGFTGQQYPTQNQGLSGQQYPIQSGTTQSSFPQGQIISGQGLSGQQTSSQRSLGESSFPQGQELSGQQYPIQSGTTHSSFPRVQIISGLSGQQTSSQRSIGESSFPQVQELSGQQYPIQSGTTQSSFPQGQVLSQTPLSSSNQNENYRTESPYLERNSSRDYSDDNSSSDLSNRESRKNTNRSIDSPLDSRQRTNRSIDSPLDSRQNTNRSIDSPLGSRQRSNRSIDSPVILGSTTNSSALSGNQGNRDFNYIDFSLHVVEARNLHNTGTIRSSDPFLEISIADESTKTKTVTNTVNPRWDETFSFKDVPSNSRILFQVFDRNLITSNQVMGRFDVDINSLREKPSNWWTLYGPEGESTSGELYIDCYFN